MSFDDALIANPGRLRILTALAVAEDGREFVGLRQVTRLTDGNLSAHAKRLAGGGLIDIDKQFRAGKPVTTFRLTGEGRRRLSEHARAVLAAVEGEAAATATAIGVEAEVAADDEWVD